MKASLSTRQEWAEDERAEYEREYFRECCMCGDSAHEATMIKHTVSGQWMHEHCKDAFVATLCDGDEKSPEFV